MSSSKSLLYDNPRTIVTAKDEATGRVSWNATFKDRMDFYGVKIRLCRSTVDRREGHPRARHLPLHRDADKVLLLGPPGVGKTRLAVAVLRLDGGQVHRAMARGAAAGGSDEVRDAKASSVMVQLTISRRRARLSSVLSRETEAEQ